MDRRCAAGALLALAACIASSAAAPTASNQTALDLYDGASEGCYYNFQHYGEGDRIMTNEPCLNCTCHNRMLMCYLRVCPFTKPIGQDCSVEKRADQCCPIVTCPDVPVDLLTSTSTTSPAEFGDTGIGKLDRYGCSINGKYFSEGSKVPSTPNKPCEHCYCIRNMTTCVMQECTLHVDGCTPIYHKEVCCPVRYSCDHPEDDILLLDDMTTTVRPTPGFLLTTTTLSPVTQMTQDCVHDDKIFADGALIKTEKACEHCYCMKGDIVCVVQECGTPMENEGKNCSSIPPREGQCCPDTYICEGDELTTEMKPDLTTAPQQSLEELTTVNPPRRTIEGSGYRSEPDKPFTEVPTYEPDNEGSGEDPEPYKPIGDEETLIPDNELSPPIIGTDNEENIDQISSSTMKIPITDTEVLDKATTEPDKGENTVPSGNVDDESSESSVKDKTTIDDEKLVTKQPVSTTESYSDVKITETYEDESSVNYRIVTEADAVVTESDPIAKITMVDNYTPSSTSSKITADDDSNITTEPSHKIAGDDFGDSTTQADTNDSTIKASDLTAPGTLTTESSLAPVDQEAKTTTVQIPEQENEVLTKEQTTQSTLDISTESGNKNIERERATTKQPEIITELSTPGKDHLGDTTSINRDDNEIDEELNTTPSPSRIPGEGDCLLNGVTYSNESIVPSSDNCHTACRCVSSIVKCDPIICSAPPDYMDNCQPMYDPPESCCPTYVCDHTKETVPPQPHSQMAETESPIQTPGIECNGDQCEVSKDKEDPSKPTGPCTSEACSENSSEKPHECGAEGCLETATKSDYEPHSLEPTGCIGEKCALPQEHCADGDCESPIKKEQSCNSENGCGVPTDQLCQGEDCKTHSEISPVTEVTAICDNASGCESPIKKDQSCNSENGCGIPTDQLCQGEDCKTYSEISPVTQATAICDNASGCKDMQIPEKTPNCEGESCISNLPPKIGLTDTEDCKDGSDCSEPNQSPVEECNEENCKKQQVPELGKPATSECNDSGCTLEDISQKTDVPEIDKISESQTTVLPGLNEIQTEEPVTSIDFDESEREKTTEPSSEVNNEEPSTKYPEGDTQTEEEIPQPPMFPTPGVETHEEPDSHTETAILKEGTGAPSKEYTKTPVEQSSTDVPILINIDTDDRTTEPPSLNENELPELGTPATEPQDDTIHEENMQDITTKPPFEPTIQEELTETAQDTTESHELPAVPEQSDVDKQESATKEPEYVLDQDKIYTDRPGTESSPLETKGPDGIYTESVSGTETPTEMSTDKSDEKPVEKESENVATTPGQHDSKTSAPEVLETDSPAQTVSEEDVSLTTAAPVKQSSLSQEKEEMDAKVSSIPEELITTPNDMGSVTEGIIPSDLNNEFETKLTISDVTEVTPKPETPLDFEGSTLAAESSVANDEELYTKPPVYDITQAPEIYSEKPKPEDTESEDKTTKVPDVIIKEQEPEDQKEVTSPEITDDVRTEAPMSIVKEYGDDETSTAIPTDIEIHASDMSTQKPEFTESVTPNYSETDVSKPNLEPSDKPEKDIEQIPRLEDDDKFVKAPEKTNIETTILPEIKDVSPTEQPIYDTETTTTSTPVASKDKAPVPVTIVEEQGSTEQPEPAVTESHKQDAPQTETISAENISTKSPDQFTETLAPTEEKESLPPTDNNSEKDNDVITDIPELTIHEHPDYSLPTEGPDQLIPEATETPQEEEVKTKAPQMSDTEVNNEITEEPQLELITVTPEHLPTEQSEFIEKDITTSIPDTFGTESLNETTEVPEPLDNLTQAPEIPEIELQKESTEAPDRLDITNVPKIPATEPVKEITEAPELQEVVTNVEDTTVTDINKIITEANTQASDSAEISTVKPTKESTDLLEPSDIATMVPDFSETSSPSEVTQAPISHDSSTSLSESETSDKPDHDVNVPELPVTESHKEAEKPDLHLPTTEVLKEITETETEKSVTGIPETQVTSLPEVSSEKPKEEVSKSPETISTLETETITPKSQEVITEVPEAQKTETNIPEKTLTDSQNEVTEAPVIQDVSTNVPETSVPELQTDVTEKPVLRETISPDSHVTEIGKEVTRAPVAQEGATNVPVAEVTQIPESYDIGTKIPDIENQEEATKAPEKQDSTSEISSQEMLTEVTLAPEIHDILTDAPKTTIAESHEVVTDIPDHQGIVTNAPALSVTEIQKDLVTDSHKIGDTGITEGPVLPDIATEIPNISEAVPEEATARTSESPEIVTNAPEISAGESQKNVTESPEQDLVTGAPERKHTDVTEQEESDATEKGESITQAPIEITTIIEDHTEPQPTKLGTDSSSEEELSNEQSTMHPDSSETESQDKVSDSDITKDKVTTDGPNDNDKTNIDEITEFISAVPTIIPEQKEPEKSDAVTESTNSLEPVDAETKTPQLDDADSEVTRVPEIEITDKKEYSTENYPQETRRTESLEHSDTLDKSSQPSEDLQPTSETKDDHDVGSTTPYLVLLDEHTHKKDINTVSFDETTTEPFEVTSGYEASTPETLQDKVTESAPSIEPENPTQEEALPNEKEQAVEKITEAPVSPEEITTISPTPALHETEKVPSTPQPQDVNSNEISTLAPIPEEEQSENEKPSTANTGEVNKEEPSATEKPSETTAPEEEFILATTKAPVKVEEELTSPSPVTDSFGKPEEALEPELEKPKPDITEDLPKPSVNEVQTTEETPQPDDDTSGTGAAGYGQEPDYGDEDQPFGPGTCRYGGKVYVSAQQIPRDDPCDFCFCFRSDIICLQQSCPPPIHGCHEEPIQGFCCPRYECPVSMATTLNVTTTTTTTTTTLPPHFLHHAYKGAAERKGCQIKGHTYKVGDVVRASSGPCLHCTCGGDGQMKCDPKVCTPEPMLRQMIAAAVSAKRRR